jgi:hypothetical protein
MHLHKNLFLLGFLNKTSFPCVLHPTCKFVKSLPLLFSLCFEAMNVHSFKSSVSYLLYTFYKGNDDDDILLNTNFSWFVLLQLCAVNSSLEFSHKNMELISVSEIKSPKCLILTIYSHSWFPDKTLLNFPVSLSQGWNWVAKCDRSGVNKPSLLLISEAWKLGRAALVFLCSSFFLMSVSSFGALNL